jgi:hypothetical protein
MSLPPERVPTSSRYSVGAAPDAGARHDSVTRDPETLDRWSVGARGAVTVGLDTLTVALAEAV